MTRNCLSLLLFTAASLGMVSLAQAQDSPGYVWIEGEDAVRKNVSRNGWYDDVKKDTFSGEEWLSHFNQNQEGSAEYVFRAPEAGEYAFWMRANPLQAKLSYQLNGRGEWQQIDMQKDQRGLINIASDNKPDLRFITWVKAGDVQLQAGRNTMTLRMHSGAQNHGGIDCFVFSRIPFVPSGATEPADQSAPGAPDEWFAVVMDNDRFSDQSVIDISDLIEAPAGKHGFLKRKEDVLQFENASAPTKFWAINAGLQGDWSPEDMTQAARWYRKHGVNLVRQHTVQGAVGLLNDNGEFDANRLDRYDRWFATLKEQGIYTTWSVVYPHHGRFLRSNEVDAALFRELDKADKEADGNRAPISVNDFINLDRRLQEVAWKYFDKLLTHKNPYTGLEYRNDPALAMVEVQNESNVFFFTLNSLLDPNEVPNLSRQMRRGFFEFAMEKYKTPQALSRAWGNKWQRLDDLNKKELALQGAHHWGSEGPEYEYKGQFRRTGDYIEYLTKIQRGYYERRETQLRDIGFKGATVTTAWKSGGPGAEMANLYADTAADVIDRHNYFGGGAGGHAITEGDVNNETHLSQPGHGLLALGMFQVGDRPFATSEVLQMAPNPWKAEAAPLLGFYGMGLQGWDAVYTFAMGSYRMGDGWNRLGKYVVETPHYMGQFPAIAFAIYNGHIQEGDVVAARHLTMEQVFSGKDPLGQALSGGGFDDKKLVGNFTTPPSTLAIGRVTISFDRGQTKLDDLTKYHDERNKVLTSTTGELVWRYGDRIVEVRTPKTQGIIGFAGNKQVDLPGAAVNVQTPFVSLILTPMDNEDLTKSREILVTAMSRDKQTGTEYNQDQSKLVTVGGPPLLMEPVQAKIQLKGDPIKQVQPLDFYGVPKSGEVAVGNDGSFEIDGSHRTYYYVIRR